MGNYFCLRDYPRGRVIYIVKDFTKRMHTRSITLLLEQMIHRMEVLGENSGDLQAYKTMAYKL